MNRAFNPEIPIYHVFYGSYFDGDPRYFAIGKAVGKEKKMTPQYHEKIRRADKSYNEYIKGQREYLEKHNGFENTVPTKEEIDRAKAQQEKIGQNIIEEFGKLTKKQNKK
jgi:hypothetical protein